MAYIMGSLAGSAIPLVSEPLFGLSSTLVNRTFRKKRALQMEAEAVEEPDPPACARVVLEDAMHYNPDMIEWCSPESVPHGFEARMDRSLELYYGENDLGKYKLRSTSAVVPRTGISSFQSRVEWLEDNNWERRGRSYPFEQLTLLKSSFLVGGSDGSVSTAGLGFQNGPIF
jgi:hypothetical protein